MKTLGSNAKAWKTMEEALQEAEALLTAGRPHAAISLLTAVTQQPQTAADPPTSDMIDKQDAKLYMKLKTACRIQLAVNKEASWWEIFALDRATATAADIRRQYKRLASLVHPDKSNLVTAEEIFKGLTKGMEELLKEVGGASQKGAKRAREEEEGEEGEDGDKIYEEEEESFEANSSDEFAWWTKWDTGASRSSSSNRKKEGEGEGKDETQAKVDEAIKEDELLLKAMSVIELQEEVRKRQNSMLDPPKRSSKEAVVQSIGDLRKALLRARTALKEKLLAIEAEALQNGTGGGFIP